MNPKIVIAGFILFAGIHALYAEGGDVKRTPKDPCLYWYSKVAQGIEPMSIADKDEKDPQTIMEAIECLLKLEGHKEAAKFGGATNFYVSQIFTEPTPVEVAALYYISYLYYQKWDHANAVVLVNKNLEYNTPETIKEAYKAYRKWFQKIRNLGLTKARERHLDPLAGTGIRWY